MLEMLVDITNRIDREVDRGYDLSDWGEQMKFLHALQIQAQALIDLVLRSSALLGHPPTTPLDAARYLVEAGVVTKNDLEFFKKVLGFRNIIVHQYTSVDISVVDSILKRREYRKILELAEAVFKKMVEKGLDP